VKDSISIAYLGNEGVAPELFAMLVKLRSFQIHTQIKPVCDFEPEAFVG
jgi:hypothetical protein